MSEPMSREQKLEEAHHETFICGLCGGVFDKGWSDEEAEAEKQEHWPRAVAHSGPVKSRATLILHPEPKEGKEIASFRETLAVNEYLRIKPKPAEGFKAWLASQQQETR